MISPFKAALGPQYKTIEHRLQQAIHIRFGLPADLPRTVEKTIKRADRASAFFEAIQIAGFSDTEARSIFGAPRNISDIALTVQPAETAQAAYMQCYQDLITEMGADRHTASRALKEA